ncbi:MAG: hypothetical protein KBS68_01785 [Clostridiales bacterium]|nr:hypothetical protein [Candidatus Crickella merdequi]
MAYIDTIETRKNMLQQKALELRRKIGQLPEGTLRCAKNNGYTQWFNYNPEKDNERVYIPKGDMRMAEKLALKGFYERQLKDIEYEIKIIDAFIKKYSRVDAQPGSSYYNRKPEYKRLIDKCLKEETPEIKEFLSMQYVTNAHPEGLKFTTKSGLKVRSKTENEIADMLDYYRLPYLYEVPYSYVKNGWTRTILLDFTILNPITFQRVGWTHMGRMDDPAYVKRNETHVADLTLLGFIPGDNLIVTYESLNRLMSSAEIDAQIIRFFPGIETWRW